LLPPPGEPPEPVLPEPDPLDPAPLDPLPPMLPEPLVPPLPLEPDVPAPLPGDDPPAVAARYSSREMEPSRLVSSASNGGMAEAPLLVPAPALEPPAELDGLWVEVPGLWLEAPGLWVLDDPDAPPALEPAASTLIGNATAVAMTTAERYFVLNMEISYGKCVTSLFPLSLNKRTTQNASTMPRAKGEKHQRLRDVQTAGHVAIYRRRAVVSTGKSQKNIANECRGGPTMLARRSGSGGRSGSGPCARRRGMKCG
jgi:hypothetical protein